MLFLSPSEGSTKKSLKIFFFSPHAVFSGTPCAFQIRAIELNLSFSPFREERMENRRVLGKGKTRWYICAVRPSETHVGRGTKGGWDGDGSLQTLTGH